MTLTVALLLPACSCSAAPHPPRDSEAYISSGSTQINAYYTDRPVEPTWFTPTPSYWCSNYTEIHYVDEIQWSSWGGSSAMGRGIAGRGCQALFPEGGEPPEGSPVTIMLGGMQECAGFEIYTTYSLELDQGAAEPAAWGELKSGRSPCNPSAAACTADSLPGHFEVHGPGDCGLGLVRLAGRRTTPVPWRPKTPPGQVPELRRLMAAQWKGWGTDTAVGRGAMLDQHEVSHGETDLLWPAVVELGDPIWCPRMGVQGLQGDYGSAIAYTSLRLTLFGNGLEEKRKKRAYNARLMLRARSMAGAAGLRKQVFSQRTGASAAACGF